jgi:hypothetical protein
MERPQIWDPESGLHISRVNNDVLNKEFKAMDKECQYSFEDLAAVKNAWTLNIVRNQSFLFANWCTSELS